ncbi:hypothetical protein [Pedobacter hiemivivus]|uniref:Uncharacterized protein n=1 Tax=Pedobacter hiemivivus TaxID=2530454 RepID=A0A4R0NEP6_9SPHI|nr:hypothetical protein [Pedobacter hiemivivus]TCC98825.1 hypothetical protein EZ444_05990 [Pedobacter hiemivivus]
MNSTLLNLHAFISQLTPRTLTLKELQKTDFDKWKSFLEQESGQLKSEMIFNLLGAASLQEKQAWLAALQDQLVLFSNQFNQYLFRDRRKWESHPDSVLIRINYLNSLSCMENLLDFINSEFARYQNSQSRVSDFRLHKVIPELRQQVRELKTDLSVSAVSQTLARMVITGLSNLLKKDLSSYGISYISGFCSQCHKITSMNDDQLCTLMISMDFNQPDFYLAKIEQTDRHLYEINGLHEQVEFILNQKEKLLRKQIISKYRLHPNLPSIWDDLRQYYNEKEQALEAMLALRRAALKDQRSSEESFRVLSLLTVPQLALFFRIQLEKGILIKEHIHDVFNFVAMHFYTEKTLFISSGSLQRKSTDVDFPTALKLWDTLSGMMEWLDEHFSVRNYQRSL